VISTQQQGNGSNRIHTTILSSLLSGTPYYYQLRLENGVNSAVYKFTTLKQQNSGQNINFIFISDTQYQSNRPNILRDMVLDGIIPVVNKEILGGLDNVHGLIVAGDLVTTGSTYSQWKTYFFDPLEPIA
jgi:hypothetical protein